MAAASNSSSHPSPELLELLEHAALEAAERDRVGAHVEDCPACKEQLFQIRNSDFAVTTGLMLEHPETSAETQQVDASWLAVALPTRDDLMRSLDPSSRFLPVSAVVTLVCVLVPALWLASGTGVS